MYVILIKKTSRNSSAYITGKEVGPSMKDVRQKKLRISDPSPLCLRFWRWKSCENKGRDIYTGHYLPSAFLRGMKNWLEDLRGMKKLEIKGMKNPQHTYQFSPQFLLWLEIPGRTRLIDVTLPDFRFSYNLICVYSMTSICPNMFYSPSYKFWGDLKFTGQGKTLVKTL